MKYVHTNEFHIRIKPAGDKNVSKLQANWSVTPI